jgi:hypothetical protein
MDGLSGPVAYPPLLFGPYGSSALAVVEQLPRYGANALWFHGFDERVFEACGRHGLAACVEFKTFRADFDARPELVPLGVDGRPIRYGRLVQGVCLSQEEFLAETEEALLDGLRAFAPAGVWLDYLTYTGWFETPTPDLQESCFCERCVTEFCAVEDVDASTPAEVMTRHAALWKRHKCERIAGFASHYAQLIRTERPGCTVGAYMCPWTPDEFEGALGRIFAQDYEFLAPAIDVFTPLIYAEKSGRSPRWAYTFLTAAPGFVPPERKVQLILDVLDFPPSLEETARSAVPSWGVQLFAGAEVFGQQEKAEMFRGCVERIRGRIAEVDAAHLPARQNAPTTIAGDC